MSLKYGPGVVMAAALAATLGVAQPASADTYSCTFSNATTTFRQVVTDNRSVMTVREATGSYRSIVVAVGEGYCDEGGGLVDSRHNGAAIFVSKDTSGVSIFSYVANRPEQESWR